MDKLYHFGKCVSIRLYRIISQVDLFQVCQFVEGRFVADKITRKIKPFKERLIFNALKGNKVALIIKGNKRIICSEPPEIISALVVYHKLSKIRKCVKRPLIKAVPSAYTQKSELFER